jgi:predicted PhzF superfamily epimerase YddE/YHI9
MQFFQIDAFTNRPFKGNPAAVCLMEKSVDDDWLQAVSSEMGLSETAFVWSVDDGFHLRWFTPKVEVDLCGHATLASAHAMWTSGAVPLDQMIKFHTRSGTLTATRVDGEIYLDFPAKLETETEPPRGLLSAMGTIPVYCGRNEFDILMEVGSQAEVENARVDFERLAEVPVRGVILTAKSDSDQFDFVSRFFAPSVGVDEDPVTGSAHVCLAPFWSKRLKRFDLVGYQASQRGGIVKTRVAGDRVHLGGQAVTIVRGELTV